MDNGNSLTANATYWVIEFKTKGCCYWVTGSDGDDWKTSAREQAKQYPTEKEASDSMRAIQTKRPWQRYVVKPVTEGKSP